MGELVIELVIELEGERLNYWVARALGWKITPAPHDWYVQPWTVAMPNVGQSQFFPSENWAQGGWIIERERISITDRAAHWVADAPGAEIMLGDTPLIAAMRAFVASKFGETVADDNPEG